ncbi:LysM domain receptor-like kinase 4 [Abeliophyllum distichum]|uniref:LysM domain receptor-like kinase 4 n=1 Tax=Abeliophyllum distichum TaxID=126358 RepID=A0ABD1Q8L9_9LAMI
MCYSQQFYDATLCSSDTEYPGTRYTCNSFQGSCHTFLVYRANRKFQTISSISTLFKMDPDHLRIINNVSNSSWILETGREVLVTITCSCTGQFFQANINYSLPENITLSEISCTIFEGLVKSITLEAEDFPGLKSLHAGSIVNVPLKCACPDKISRNSGVKYFVTYPFIEGDDIKKLSLKFNISVEEIWETNNLDPTTTVYPNTTVLVPLKAKPFINLNIPDTEPPTPDFLPTIPVERRAKIIQLKKLLIAVSVVGFFLILATLVSCGLYIKASYKLKADKFHSSMRRSSLNSCSTPRSSPFSEPPTRGSTNSCLSPDLLVGIKYSLCNYGVEEIKQATKNFSEDSRISPSVYKGLIDNGEMMIIKQMRFEGTRQVIDVHSKINHVNIVKLHGVCYGKDDFSWSYLVFEFPVNGSLRDCLSSSSTSLSWHRRTQIAFDIATGLHYLHYCVVPSYIHMNINSKGIFLTSNWRAKLTIFGAIPVDDSLKDSGSLSNLGGWVAPEYVLYGSTTETVNIFAYGVVLLELISGKEAADGKLFEESIKFFGGGANEGSCFEQLRNFVDPCLKEDYPIAEALCLAVLASSCVEEDPLHRPSMDDVIKILARMV